MYRKRNIKDIYKTFNYQFIKYQEIKRILSKVINYNKDSIIALL